MDYCFFKEDTFYNTAFNNKIDGIGNIDNINTVVFVDILSRLKTGRFLCTNVRCCPSSLILTPQFGDAPPKYIISC